MRPFSSVHLKLFWILIIVSIHINNITYLFSSGFSTSMASLGLHSNEQGVCLHKKKNFAR